MTSLEYYYANKEKVLARMEKKRRAEGTLPRTVVNRRVRRSKEHRKESQYAYTRKASLAKLGTTEDVYNTLLDGQGHSCAICGYYDLTDGKRLAVDHDHKTGRIRELLCGSCNRGLGFFNDSIEKLQQAIRYLHTHA